MIYHYMLNLDDYYIGLDGNDTSNIIIINNNKNWYILFIL
jgi:hypothetical protein